MEDLSVQVVRAEKGQYQMEAVLKNIEALLLKKRNELRF